jgi:hydroxylaminobenzene mutase
VTHSPWMTDQPTFGVAPWPPQLPPAPAPRLASTARWAFGMSVLALALAPLLGGVVPAIVALVLVRAARHDLAPAQGWLLGDRTIARARVLAWCALVVATAVAITVTVSWLVGLGETLISPVYPHDVN